MDNTFRLSNGVTIPAVGYGSFLSTEKNGIQTIKDALDAGYRYIDTAMLYRNEHEILYKQNGQFFCPFCLVIYRKVIV